MDRDKTKKIIAFGLTFILVLMMLIPSINSKFDNRSHIGSKKNNLIRNPLSFKNKEWWNESWLYRKNITIDHNKVDDNLNNFTMLISLNADTNLADHAQQDGDDIVFTDSYGNKLHHEIELFNGTTGELISWVNVTSLSSTSDTVLCMYYGNPTTTNQQNTQDAWDTHYVMVQHLNETSGTHYDSTPFDNDGTPVNGVNQSATGKIDGADEFDDVDDYILINDSASLNIVNLTIECWFNDYGAEQGVRGVWQGIVSKKASAWTLTTDPQNYWPPRLLMYIGNKPIHPGPAGEITFNTWYHVALVINGSIAMLYMNGQFVVKGENVTVISTDSDLYIGRNHWNADDLFNGTIDEVRISNIARDGSWINTSYNNQNEPSTFYSIGNEEVFNNPPYEPSNPDPINGSYNVNINVNLSWTGGDPDPGDTLTYDVYFGNNSPPPKVVDNQTNTVFDPGTLEINSTYYWRIIAWDDIGWFTKSPLWLFSTGDNMPPAKPDILLASAFGRPGTQLNFSVVTIDPDEDEVYYKWDWGDGNYSDWLGPYSSGLNITTNHTWTKLGEFEIKVKAKDSNNIESPWSDPVQTIIEDMPPTVEITKPIQGAIYLIDELLCSFITNIIIGPITITVKASDNISGINRVETYIDDKLKNTDFTQPYRWRWVEKVFVFSTIKIVAFDNAGNYAIQNMKVFKFF